MRYYKPMLQLERPSNAGQPEKFGGLPEGLPPKFWPVCAECGNPQSFNAQFAHDTDRLDLGRAGRTLFLFQCGVSAVRKRECGTWDPSRGANSAFVLEPEELVFEQATQEGFPGPVQTELHIVGWTTHEDCIAEEEASGYFDFDAFLQMGQDKRLAVDGSTRLGSVPLWLQRPECGPQEQWKFVAQLDSFHVFEAGGKTVGLDAANYGGGLAYVFLERNPPHGTPRAQMLWQC